MRGFARPSRWHSNALQMALLCLTFLTGCRTSPHATEVPTCPWSRTAEERDAERRVAVSDPLALAYTGRLFKVCCELEQLADPDSPLAKGCLEELAR